MHRTIIAVDIKGFGPRTMPDQLGTRAGLYKVVEEAFGAACVPWDRCRIEDRGDAVFILVPPDIPKATLVEVVPEALAHAVRAHNHKSHQQQRVRLRMAIHAGEVAFDDHGVTSTAVITTFRLLDAEPVKQALANSPGMVALVVSRWVFDEVVRHSTVLDPATFRPIPVEVKETDDTAWIALPDQPYPADPAVLDHRNRHRTTQVLAPPVDEQLRLLARASWNQWTAAANDRRLLHPVPLPIRWRLSTAPVAGPASAAAFTRFDPLPGLAAVDSSELGAGDQDALHRIYGGLPSGRLLLVGPAGSGKSAAAILLLRDALLYRQARPDEQAGIPVPVLFTLHGWDPDRGESVIDWMAGKLAETYPMFRSRTGRRAATELVTAGRVAGFLDGLDEIPEAVRPGVLKALADAPFRLVLLSRTEEAVAAAKHGPLAGAVALALQPVAPTDAATYLLEPLVDPPPAPWKAIGKHLAEVADHRRSASALSNALNTPLSLSLLRDVYGPTDPVNELLNDKRFPAAADIENHLLDHAVTAAYTPRPGHPRPPYSVATAHRTLRYLATQLTEHDTVDLAWWHIPTWTWTTRRSRMIITAVANALANGLTLGLPLGLVFGPAPGLVSGLVVGSMIGLMMLFGGWAAHAQPVMPQRIARLTYPRTVQNLVFGLTIGLGGGLLAGLSAGLMFGLSAGLVSGFSVGLPAGLAGVFLHGLATHTELDENSLGPADVWRHDRNAGLGHWLMSGLVVGLLAVLMVRLAPGLASGLASRLSVVIAVGLTVGLVVGLGAMVMLKRVGTAASAAGGAASATALAAVELRIRHKIPLRLIAFLDDARSRHLLRTVGPVYQFRHAKLQERLTSEGS